MVDKNIEKANEIIDKHAEFTDHYADQEYTKEGILKMMEEYALYTEPVSEWIRVEDRLPNQSSYPNLLLYSPEFGIVFGLYNGSWFESPMIDNDEKLLNTITHYQNPLPPALKELNKQ